MSDALRKAFEAWVSAPPYEKNIDRWPDRPGSTYSWPGQYQVYETQVAWDAWQAAALAAPAELQQPHKYGADVHCPMIPCAVCDTPAELQQPVAQEPVAWAWVWARSKERDVTLDSGKAAELSKRGYTVTPLYAAPMVADAARPTAEERSYYEQWLALGKPWSPAPISALLDGPQGLYGIGDTRHPYYLAPVYKDREGKIWSMELDKVLRPDNWYGDAVVYGGPITPPGGVVG